ncbi:hypothetical protein JTE90_011690 [Oedothorax gibbosus]|uniref:GST C-terminal domain-containing protein n=1 Tax=Oedothorax gibbosus TaxID=931172 RepID=A0AAV6US77_9ARAC|nr:hypothetical protein JTE90_011690 [Oedothorax gibbosus]
MDTVKLVKDAGRILNINTITTLNSLNYKIAIETKTGDGEIINGFIPAALYIGRLSSRKGFNGVTKEEQASVYQWLEYCLLHANQQDIRQVLKELDFSLKDKVYFVGNQLTVADLFFYLTLHETYSKLSFQDKELYFNLSRWFRQVQNEACAHELYPKISFAKTRMYH